MKRKYVAGLSVLLTIGLAGWALADAEARSANGAAEGLTGSKHDFSHEDWSGGDACVACHSPDQSEVPTTAPLWDPNADLTRRFGTGLARRTGADMNVTRRNAASKDTSRLQPGRGTTTCLRCHDGTIASDAVAGVRAASINRTTTGNGQSDATGRTTTGGGRSSSARFANQRHSGLFSAGRNRTDHPVGVRYPQFDRAYRPLPSVVARGTVLLPNGQVECNSCHDPHNATGEPHMLVTTNTRSALCLACHKK